MNNPLSCVANFDLVVLMQDRTWRPVRVRLDTAHVDREDFTATMHELARSVYTAHYERCMGCQRSYPPLAHVCVLDYDYDTDRPVDMDLRQMQEVLEREEVLRRREQCRTQTRAGAFDDLTRGEEVVGFTADADFICGGCLLYTMGAQAYNRVCEGRMAEDDPQYPHDREGNPIGRVTAHVLREEHRLTRAFSTGVEPPEEVCGTCLRPLYACTTWRFGQTPTGA